MTAAESGLPCGTVRTAWIDDGLAHVLEHAGSDEPCGTWTGLACNARGLAIGTDADPAILRDLCSGQRVADLTWEPPDGLAGGHRREAMRAWHAGDTSQAERHRAGLQAFWSQMWTANCAALGLLQQAGLERFAPYRPQQWIIASFEHHCSPHAAPRPHIHNIVIPALTTTAKR
jgi:hypothetical protein